MTLKSGFTSAIFRNHSMHAPHGSRGLSAVSAASSDSSPPERLRSTSGLFESDTDKTATARMSSRLNDWSCAMALPMALRSAHRVPVGIDTSRFIPR
eukprot:scaffold136047_cov37-Tisochrysis_lutea.AAC.3